MSVESVIPSNHLILCPPLLLLPSIFPHIRVFSNELALCIKWPRASLVVQMVKNPATMRETWFWSLGWEDSLEEGMATYASILSWRIPMDRGAWRAPVRGVTKSWTQLSDFHTHTTSTPRFYNCHLIFWWFSEEVKHNRTLHPKHLNTRNIKCGPDSILGARSKEHACQCRRLKGCRFDPWVGKIPWKRAWQPTSVFLPGKSPWTEEPGRLQSMASQRVGHDWATRHNTSVDLPKALPSVTLKWYRKISTLPHLRNIPNLLLQSLKYICLMQIYFYQI